MDGEWLQNVFTREAIIYSLTDPKTALIPVLGLILLWRRIGGFKAVLFSLLAFTVLLATWHEVAMNESAARILILGLLSAFVTVYFVYLLTLGREVKE